MSDRDDPNLTMPPRRGTPPPRATIKDRVATKFIERVAPPESGVVIDHAKVAERIADSKRWWIGAGAFAFLAVLLATGAAWFAVQKDLNLLLAVVLCAPGGISLLVAFFCASQASGEVTKAFLSSIVDTVNKLRGK